MGIFPPPPKDNAIHGQRVPQILLIVICSLSTQILIKIPCVRYQYLNHFANINYETKANPTKHTYPIERNKEIEMLAQKAVASRLLLKKNEKVSCFYFSKTFSVFTTMCFGWNLPLNQAQSTKLENIMRNALIKVSNGFLEPEL